MDWLLDRAVDQNRCGASVTNTRITGLDLADDTVIFAESQEVLVLALEALHVDMKPLGLQVSWIKGFGDLLDEEVQSAHVCGEYIKIMNDFTYLGSAVHSSGGSFHETLRQIG